MAKSFKGNAAAVLGGIAAGQQISSSNTSNVMDAQTVTDAKDVHSAQGTTSTHRKYSEPTERLNLKIPKSLKAYLRAAAFRESTVEKQVSATEYLCALIQADMDAHREELNNGQKTRN